MQLSWLSDRGNYLEKLSDRLLLLTTHLCYRKSVFYLSEKITFFYHRQSRNGAHESTVAESFYYTVNGLDLIC